MPTQRTIPNNLYQKYTQEREHLYERLFVIEDAIDALASGNVASYSLGNRSVSYQNMNELKDLKAATEDEIDRIEALLSHRAPRNVACNVFECPAITMPRKL